MEENFRSPTTGIYVLRQNFKVSDPILTGRARQKSKQTAMEEKKLRWESKNCDPQLQDSAGFVEACWTRRMVWRLR
jgi:hypothetical protein